MSETVNETPVPGPEFSEDFFEDSQSKSVLDRLAQTRRVQTVSPDSDIAVCPQCGSTWFAELQFRQYKANVYSYGPGGDLQPVSPAPVPMRACLCGYVLEPNITSQGVSRGAMARMLDSFMESFSRAASFRSALVQKVQAAITTNDMKPRDEMLADAKNFIEKLRKRLGAEKEKEQAKPSPKKKDEEAGQPEG